MDQKACRLPAYLDAHDLPEEIGKLSLSDLVAPKAVLLDAAYPGYYFTEKLVLGLKEMQLKHGFYGLLINLLQAGGPEATL